MKKLLVLALLLLAVPASAITLQQAQDEAHAWIVARKDAIHERVAACIREGKPSLCHTAWAASTTPNTTAASPALATVTLDDPGRKVRTSCGECYEPQGRFSDAGVAIPATAPVNAKLNICRDPSLAWGVQLVIQIRYAGQLYERGYGYGVFPGFDWTPVQE